MRSLKRTSASGLRYLQAFSDKSYRSIFVSHQPALWQARLYRRHIPVSGPTDCLPRHRLQLAPRLMCNIFWPTVSRTVGRILSRLPARSSPRDVSAGWWGTGPSRARTCPAVLRYPTDYRDVHSRCAETRLFQQRRKRDVIVVSLQHDISFNLLSLLFLYHHQ